MELELGPAGAVRAEFLPEPQPAAKPAPSSPVIEIVSTPSSRDYMLESSIGTRLTPERLAGTDARRGHAVLSGVTRGMPNGGLACSGAA